MQLIFDIGKTNKKCYLFDSNEEEIWSTQIQIPEIQDEDGDTCDDLNAIIQWIKTTLSDAQSQFEVQKINFSTYGASFVYIDKNGKVLTPLYNYLKPYPKAILQDFYHKYGNELEIASTTASPPLQMLNSGLQLYWLKYARPEIFRQVKYALHFPQYLSYLFTNKAVSEFTSIGCHTMLWDFKKHDYHDWVYRENVDKILPPIVMTNTFFEIKHQEIGLGIHDSSAALIPYLRMSDEPFLLLSTGTWSIALNPFTNASLTTEDLQNDVLNYMRMDGQPVRAARLFLGNEFEIQVQRLAKHFKVEMDFYKKIRFNSRLYQKLQPHFKRYFQFQSISLSDQSIETLNFDVFNNIEVAYHQLMLELVILQIKAINRAMANSVIHKIYIDGGFVNNDVFLNMLDMHYIDKEIVAQTAAFGSAKGAMMIWECN